MSVAKVIEVSASSTTSFEDAINQGLNRACDTIDNVRGAWIKEQKVSVESGRITSYLVNMQVTFVLDGGA
ncbi:MAG: dodecin family protein [Polaromonas sp.]